MNQILYRPDQPDEMQEWIVPSVERKSHSSNTRKVAMPISVLAFTICLVGVSCYFFSGAIASSNEAMVPLQLENKVEEEETVIQVEVPQNEIQQEDTYAVEEEAPEAPVAPVQTYTASNGESYSVIATLDIDSLDIHYPVLSSTSDALLKISLNKYWGANPNEVGNFCIVGHNYNDNKFFSRLPKISLGDIVSITDMSGRQVNYTVYDTFVVSPDDTTCTSQLTNGKVEITLITCTNHGKERLVVKARAN